MATPYTPINSPAELQAVTTKTKVVLVKFSGPDDNELLSEAFETVAASWARPGLTGFALVDTPSVPELVGTYDITATPTFLLFRDGKITKRIEHPDVSALIDVVGQIRAEVEKSGDSAQGASGSGSSAADGWRGAELPRNYRDITDQIEVPRCELLNVDSDAGGVRVLFSGTKPSALLGKKDSDGAKDWVESDTDEQLLLFLPFQSMIKLHTLQITSLPPTENDDDDDDDEPPMRPRHIKLYSNKPHNLGFDEAEDTAATQDIELAEGDWNAEGTASVPLRFVKFQNINSLVLFVVSGDGDGEKVRVDRLRLIGDAGEKREMGKLEKIGDEPGE